MGKQLWAKLIDVRHLKLRHRRNITHKVVFVLLRQYSHPQWQILHPNLWLLFLISSVYNSQAYWQSKKTISLYSFYCLLPRSHATLPPTLTPLVATDWAWDQEVDLELSVCWSWLLAETADWNKWLCISVPAGNAIQAFGYGIDSTQTKNVSVLDPSTTPKTGADWSTSTTDPPFVTIPKVIGLHRLLHCWGYYVKSIWKMQSKVIIYCVLVNVFDCLNQKY